MKTLEELIQDNDWISISCYEYLTEEFIEKHLDKVNWNYISVYQKLSEEFIEKHSDKVNWEYISIYQKLSKSFIEKYKYKFGKNYLSHEHVIYDEVYGYNFCKTCRDNGNITSPHHGFELSIRVINCQEFVMERALK